MLVTTDDKKQYEIVLRPFDGKQWLPDIAGEVLDTWADPTVGLDPVNLQWLTDDIELFNQGKDLDWLKHDVNNQQMLLTIVPVTTNNIVVDLVAHIQARLGIRNNDTTVTLVCALYDAIEEYTGGARG